MHLPEQPQLLQVLLLIHCLQCHIATYLCMYQDAATTVEGYDKKPGILNETLKYFLKTESDKKSEKSIEHLKVISYW